MAKKLTKKKTKDVTGKEISKEDLKGVAGGMRSMCACTCSANTKSADYQPDGQ